MSPPGSDSAPALSPSLAIAATVVGVAALVGLAPSLLGVAGLGPRGFLAVSSILLGVPALLTVVVLRGQGWASALGLGTAPARIVLLSALLGGALWVASIGLMEMQALVLPPPPEYLEAFRRLHAALAPSGPLDALWSVVVIAVLPALAEEVVMRGVLLPSLVRPLGVPGAVLASAAAFAAIHLDPYRFLFTFSIGLVLGVLRLRTGSLWPPIVAHATLNTATFVVAPLIDDPTQTTYTPQTMLGVLCLVAGTAAAWPLVRALRAPVDSPGDPS